LKLKHQVDALADENVGVAQGLARAVAVVKGDELHVLARRGGDHAACDFAGEFGVALSGETDAEGTRRDRTKAVAVDAGTDTLDEATMNERAQQAEGGGFRQACPLHHFGEREFLAKVAKGLEHFAGAEYGLRFIAISVSVAVALARAVPVLLQIINELAFVTPGHVLPPENRSLGAKIHSVGRNWQVRRKEHRAREQGSEKAGRPNMRAVAANAEAPFGSMQSGLPGVAADASWRWLQSPQCY